MDISELSALLAERAEALCRELLPLGVKEGDEWFVGSIAGEKGRSMAVHLTGERAGVWKDFSTYDDAGDALDLVAKVKFGGDLGAACRWTRAWLGVDQADPDSFKTKRARPSRMQRHAEDEEATRRKRALAWQLWDQAAPKIAGTPVDLYLKGRGLDLAPLGRQPGCLRHAAACLHKASGKSYHAMMTAVVSPSGKFMACHRTYLASGNRMTSEGPEPFWGKAPLPRAKLVLGSTRTGAIHLWRGEAPDLRTGELIRARRPKELTPAHAAVPGRHANNSITLTEGIEDGLTVALADPGRRVWAALSISNMVALKLPEPFHQVTIVADNDRPDSPAGAALIKAARRFQAEGRAVYLVRPPKGTKDVNALLRGAA